MRCFYARRYKRRSLSLLAFEGMSGLFFHDICRNCVRAANGDDVYDAEDMRLQLTGEAGLVGADGKVTNKADVTITDGNFRIESILPGTYTYVLYGEDGTSLGSGSVTIFSGDNVGLEIRPTESFSVPAGAVCGEGVWKGLPYCPDYDACDLRNVIHPKRPDDIMERLDMKKPYFQVFSGKYGFIRNLSIMDLLFNEGPDSILWLKNI